jgi:hypothetical protein
LILEEEVTEQKGKSMKTIQTLLIFAALASLAVAADPLGPTDEQLKKLIADSVEYKKKALGYLTADLARARSAPLQGANRVEAAKIKGERIAAIEKQIKELKSNPNFVYVEPFNWTKMEPGTIGIIPSDGVVMAKAEVSRIVNESQAVIDVQIAAINLGGNGRPDRKSETVLVSGIDTKGLRDGVPFNDLRVFQVVGNTKHQGSTVIEIKPFDIEARIAAMKKK